MALDVIATWLRRRHISDIDSKMLERIVHGAKILQPGKRVNINHNNYLLVQKNYLALVTGER